MKSELPPPSQPLQNPTHERFAELVAEGHSQAATYRKLYPTAGRGASRTTASQLANTPRVKARIQWLKLYRKDRLEAISAQNTPLAREARPPAPPPNEADNTPITREEVVLQLSKAIRGGVPSEVTAAASTLVKIAPEIGATADSDKPDPLAVALYLSSWAGYEGRDLAKKLGGLELLTRKWVDVLQVDIRELQAVIQKIIRSGTEPGATPTA